MSKHNQFSSTPPISDDEDTAEPSLSVLSQALRRSNVKLKSDLDAYSKAAKWLCRSLDPFINFFEILTVCASLTGSGRENDRWKEHLLECSEEHFHEIYAVLRAKIRGFRTHISELEHHGEDLEALAKLMSESAARARSDDIGSLRDAGLAYVELDTKLDPSIPPRSQKSEHRGFRNLTTARLLCPVRVLAEFKANSAQTIEKLHDGRIQVTGDDLPSFLYPDGQYDPEDLDKGLMRGPLVVRIWRHLFTSPSSAVIPLGQQRAVKTKGCQATMNGLTTPTPATIAYAALQTYWMLCPLDDWRLDDGVFDKQEFFRNVVNIFSMGQWEDVDSENNEWAEETLRWWEEQVLPLKALNRASYEGTISSDSSTLWEQRRTKTRARKAPSTPSSSPSRHSATLPNLANLPLPSPSAPVPASPRAQTTAPSPHAHGPAPSPRPQGPVLASRAQTPAPSPRPHGPVPVARTRVPAPAPQAHDNQDLLSPHASISAESRAIPVPSASPRPAPRPTYTQQPAPTSSTVHHTSTLPMLTSQLPVRHRSVAAAKHQVLLDFDSDPLTPPPPSPPKKKTKTTSKAKVNAPTAPKRSLPRRAGTKRK
ncbi:hypothetical protein LshimejAT787_1002080 [Lyophyllum shimeji]|uniref:Uncharacterized protein n=1 Tax=Lyophyllum shimeji TaxID=47721 RepID=A0A9P3PT80_LYOSH|nr:hypothetical protein LshimejAT787_1002080 [Lyophyllum shimeji]